jgi:hypothetical protein
MTEHTTCPVCQREVETRHLVLANHARSPDADADQCPASGLTVDQARQEIDRELDRLRRMGR